MQGYRDDGVVLRTQKLGEADRIITLLTRHNGRVRAVARGVRRTKSRFGARLEPFTHVDVLIYPGRSLDAITQAEVIRSYGTPLVSDYPKYTAGTAMLETAERFTPVEKEPAIRQFLLLIGGLRALGDAVEPDGTAEEEGTAGQDRADGSDGVSTSGGAGGLGDAGGPGGIGGVGATGGPGGVGGPIGAGRSDGGGGPVGSADAGKSREAPRDPRMVLDAYFLRSLTFAGYAPALEECARCGAPDAARDSAARDSAARDSAARDSAARDNAARDSTAGRAARGTANGGAANGGVAKGGTVPGGKPLVAFAVAAGGMVCADCRPPGSASPAPQTVALMVALLRGNWDEAMQSVRRHRVECSGLVATYLQWHLEHSIRSLRHVERA